MLQPLFPGPAAIAAYVKDGARSLEQHISLSTRVTRLRWTTKEDGGEQRKWFIETKSTSTPDDPPTVRSCCFRRTFRADPLRPFAGRSVRLCHCRQRPLLETVDSSYRRPSYLERRDPSLALVSLGRSFQGQGKFDRPSEASSLTSSTTTDRTRCRQWCIRLRRYQGMRRLHPRTSAR